MRILFLSRWCPYPPDNGSKIRIFNVLRQLARRHSVSVLAFGDTSTVGYAEPLDRLRSFCTAARILPYRPFEPTRAKAIAGFVSRQPRSLVDTHSLAMREAIGEELSRAQFDLVIASQLGMLPYTVGVPHVPAMLEELELSVFIDATVGKDVNALQRLRAQLTWWKLSSYLRQVLPTLRACTVASERERANIQGILPSYRPIAVIPNAVDAAEYAADLGPVEARTLVFSGALTYEPNADAVRYFLNCIYPLIHRAAPGVKLRVTGRHDGFDLRRFRELPGVEFTGYVEDVRPVVARSSLSVVPLRRGGGTRLKILEAMALGTPVVSTTKGAEGLDVTDGDNIALADDPQGFADRVLELLNSADARARLAIGGRQLVGKQYDWAVVGEQLCAVVEAAVTRERRIAA